MTTIAPATRDAAVRGAGLALSMAGCGALLWLFVHQPTNLEELTGGVAASVGVYQINQADFDQGRQFFDADKFVEARAAFMRADPASRHALTQFYIAYSWYRQGWGRVYNDDTLFAQGLEAVNRAIALAPDGRLRVDDATPRHEDRGRAEGGTRAGPEARRLRLQSPPRAADTPMTPTPWSRLAVREAVVLPLIFLLVAAGGGFRSGVADGAWRFLPPTPMALVLGLLMVGVLVRTGVLAPWTLIGPQRSGLANANGAMLVATLLVASAQIFTALSPESGLLQVLASVFFLLLLINTLAARPTRARAMQSLGVVLLAAFVLKYVVLDALYAPEGSLARKVVTTLLEGVSLGALGYTSHGTATGYVAFVVVLVYLFALVLLPGEELVGTPRRGVRLQSDDPDGRLHLRPGSGGQVSEPSLPKEFGDAALPVTTSRSSDAPLARRDPGDR